MTDQQADAVAALHIHAIERGFLSKLGPKLLADLYRTVERSGMGLVFVALDENGREVGFVSGSTAPRRMYRWVFLRRGWLYALWLSRHFLRWSMLTGLVRSALIPSRMGGDYPVPELLSMGVREEVRGSPVARDLLAALLAEFRARNCPQIKLIVGTKLARAQAFYLKNGFRQVGIMDTHHHQSYVYVIDAMTDGPR